MSVSISVSQHILGGDGDFRNIFAFDLVKSFFFKEGHFLRNEIIRNEL